MFLVESGVRYQIDIVLEMKLLIQLLSERSLAFDTALAYDLSYASSVDCFI